MRPQLYAIMVWHVLDVLLSADMHLYAVEDLSLQMALREKRYFMAAVQAGDHSPKACQHLKVLESHGDQVLDLSSNNPSSIRRHPYL